MDFNFFLVDLRLALAGFLAGVDGNDAPVVEIQFWEVFHEGIVDLKLENCLATAVLAPDIFSFELAFRRVEQRF